MNKNIKKIYLAISLLGNLNIINSFATKPEPAFPLINKAYTWAQKDNNAEHVLESFLAGFLAHQYYKHKTRPKDEDISAEGFKRRWNEIVHGNLPIFIKIKLLISFIDDFYVFGRRPKTVEIETKTIDLDGNEITIKDKKTVIKGTGPITFLYENIFDKLEDILKSLGTLGTFALLIDGLLGKQVHLLLKPSSATFTPLTNDNDKTVPSVNGKGMPAELK